MGTAGWCAGRVENGGGGLQARSKLKEEEIVGEENRWKEGNRKGKQRNRRMNNVWRLQMDCGAMAAAQ